MLKKIIMLLLPLFVFVPSAFADEVQDVQAFFNSFVNASNTYATNIPNYYVKNAKIVRVVYKGEYPDPMARAMLEEAGIEEVPLPTLPRLPTVAASKKRG